MAHALSGLPFKIATRAPYIDNMRQRDLYFNMTAKG
jgi:hypothetical protein